MPILSRRVARSTRAKLGVAMATGLLLGLPAAGSGADGDSPEDRGRGDHPGVYAMTNAAGDNEVVAYRRTRQGHLKTIGRYDTGGEGTGRARLSSQGSVILDDDAGRLYVANVGSDDISVFAVRRDATLRLIEVVGSGGDMPYSVALSPDGDHLHALNNGGAGAGSITGFEVDDDGGLTPLASSTRPLSGAGTDPAQVAYTPDGKSLVVTEKATSRLLTYRVGRDGRAQGPEVVASEGTTPFGFAFTDNGGLVVSEAQEGVAGAATASSYAVGDDDRFLYAIDIFSGEVHGWQVRRDGSLDKVGEFAGLPPTVAGLAAG